jgi:NRPS condensation-like uncharacterized protein
MVLENMKNIENECFCKIRRKKMNKFPILNERLYLRSPSINVCFRVIIEGIFDKNKIENALEAVSIKHPFLNSSVEIDSDNNAWLVQKNGSIGIEYYESSKIVWQEWYKKNDNTAFDFSKNPLVKFCVIASKNTEIIILGHHIIGDGIGYLNLVKDILLALDNKLDSTPQIPPFEPTDRYFKETALLDSGVSSFANGLNEEWKQNRVNFSEKDYLTFFENYRKKYIPSLHMASVEEDNLNILMEKAKTNGFTVNEIISSAFSIATMETLNKNEIRLGIAGNIRNELVSEPNNCMGNFVTGISAKANYASTNDFISNSRVITSAINDQLKDAKNRHLVIHFLNEFDKDFIESIMFAAYGGFEHSASKKLAELIGEKLDDKGLGISNLGRFNITNYENIKIVDLQFIGPAFPANLLTVGLITVNNKLNLCLRYNEGEIKIDTVKKIYERAIELLR